MQTFIQSGNIIFEHKKENAKTIVTIIRSKIEEMFGFVVPVINMTEAELNTIIENNYFPKDKTKHTEFLYVTFLAETPSAAEVVNFEKNTFLRDEFFIKDKAVYLYCPNSYSKSKLTNTFIENKLKIVATTRNWKTVNALLNLATNL